MSILDQHDRLIYKIAKSYCRDTEERKDLIQEIMLQLWRSFDKYDNRYKWSTWIYRIALNVSISYLRKSKVRAEYNSKVDVAASDDGHDNRQSEELDQLYSFIDQFDRLNKALIILYLEDNSYADIAKILGITETNVATKLSRIKKKLKEQFEQNK